MFAYLAPIIAVTWPDLATPRTEIDPRLDLKDLFIKCEKEMAHRYRSIVCARSVVQDPSRISKGLARKASHLSTKILLLPLDCPNFSSYSSRSVGLDSAAPMRIARDGLNRRRRSSSSSNAVVPRLKRR